MKSTYSLRWVLCWALMIVGMLVLIAAVFTVASDWKAGAALGLIGLGIVVPTMRWLLRTTRRARVRGTVPLSAAGVIMVVAGSVLYPWSSQTWASGEADVETPESVSETTSVEDPGFEPTDAEPTEPQTDDVPETVTAEPVTVTETAPEMLPTVTETEVQVAPPSVETVQPQQVTVTETYAPPQVTVTEVYAPPQEVVTVVSTVQVPQGPPTGGEPTVE